MVATLKQAIAIVIVGPPTSWGALAAFLSFISCSNESGRKRRTLGNPLGERCLTFFLCFVSALNGGMITHVQTLVTGEPVWHHELNRLRCTRV
uniref:Uncharacterized protein n=1 Tax=Anopheles albimanus TaxID=7167 RepID=A0A182F1X1_ANOAL